MFNTDQWVAHKIKLVITSASSALKRLWINSVVKTSFPKICIIPVACWRVNSLNLSKHVVTFLMNWLNWMRKIPRGLVGWITSNPLNDRKFCYRLGTFSAFFFFPDIFLFRSRLGPRKRSAAIDDQQRVNSRDETRRNVGPPAGHVTRAIHRPSASIKIRFNETKIFFSKKKKKKGKGGGCNLSISAAWKWSWWIAASILAPPPPSADRFAEEDSARWIFCGRQIRWMHLVICRLLQPFGHVVDALL